MDLIPEKCHFPRSHRPCLERDLSLPPHVHLCVQEGREHRRGLGSVQSVVGIQGPQSPSHQGPGLGALKKALLRSSLCSQVAFLGALCSQCSQWLFFFFFFFQMTLNLPSNKNKYVCLFPGPLTALSWPHDLGGIDGPVSLRNQVHLLLKVVSK